MGFLNLFFKKGAHKLAPIPKGSFTVDRHGRIMASTLPRAFPKERLVEVGEVIMNIFRGAKDINTPFTEVLVRFGALNLLAREMRGGAIVFLMPQSLTKRSNHNPKP